MQRRYRVLRTRRGKLYRLPSPPAAPVPVLIHQHRRAHLPARRRHGRVLPVPPAIPPLAPLLTRQHRKARLPAHRRHGRFLQVPPAPRPSQRVMFTLGTARQRWRVTGARNGQGGGMTLTQFAVSTEDVQVLVAATLNGTPYNPSGDAAAIAFVAQPSVGTAAAPAWNSSAWNTAFWEVDGGPQYWASCLVGPLNGGVNLTAGAYQCFIKITDSPEVPILAGPMILIT